MFGGSAKKNLDRLELVLARLRAANLKLKPSKCELLRTEVGFLGHRISAAGIATDPDKISAVRDWPTPKNLSEVRSFVGLASYYRRMVRGFAEIASPLHHLAGKNVPFQWSENC